MKRKVIIDCDPGADDMMALMLAAKSEELEILGITVCCGNVPVGNGALNVLRTLKVCDRLDIPVYLGADKPWAKPYDGEWEQRDNSGVENLIVYPHADEFIADTLNTYEGVSILALAPLTNIANALKLDRNAFKRVDEFLTMGGAFARPGNMSEYAEFNMWVDPHAAAYVYEKMPVEIQAIGLDITSKMVMTMSILNELSKSPCTREYGFMKDVLTPFIANYWEWEQLIGCALNDQLVISYFLDKSICKGVKAHITVDTEGATEGWTHETPGSNNTLVLNQVDAEKAMKMFAERVFKMDLGSLVDLEVRKASCSLGINLKPEMNETYYDYYNRVMKQLIEEDGSEDLTGSLMYLRRLHKFSGFNKVGSVTKMNLV